MQKHILGFPRIGKDRELKKALELYWQGETSLQDLNETASALRIRNWQIQKDSGMTYVATGDFSLYDHVLDTTQMLGLVPERFVPLTQEDETNTYFKMAKGDAKLNIPAMEMTKWFNTNYHYIVPELSSFSRPKLSNKKLVNETREALALGFTPKPVLLGPISFISLSKGMDRFDKWNLISDITSVYEEIIRELSNLSLWIQIDEPVLSGDMEPEAVSSFKNVYERLNKAAGGTSLMLTTYFDNLDDNLDLALDSGCGGLHIDIANNIIYGENIAEEMPEEMILSAGVVSGRNIWKTDLKAAYSILKRIHNIKGDRMMTASGCSFLHVPVDISTETTLNPELRSWMSFAVQKCDEVNILGELLKDKYLKAELDINEKIIQSRRESPLVNNHNVTNRVNSITPYMLVRKTEFSQRKKEQAHLNLPLFPTTTIGSFPQTAEIREKRKLLRRGYMFAEDYISYIKDVIRNNIKTQEELGLDVLVHGEPERNDMVEYFGQQLNGFCFTSGGWVQSYGSRCVKPPIIYGDVSRNNPMTSEWISYAQSLTDKPVKGMLTGPVTIACWSFVRDDISREEVFKQIALCIRDEVLDLEQHGISIIQIDEAAFSEGMPTKQKDRQKYLNSATEAFRICTSGVADRTQIHTHMCYSEFNSILSAIADMDADVISIESSRSGMELLNAFKDFEYPNDIGPGVYDIHSARVPSQEEITALIEKALENIPEEKLWINPDCGLKTRGWTETEKSLRNMVNAAKNIRVRMLQEV